MYIPSKDIYIGDADKIPATTAIRERSAGVPSQYDVYLDGNKVGSTAATEYLLENLSPGSHTAGVRSIYASGVTEMSTIRFDISLSGIDVMSESRQRIFADTNAIVINGTAIGETVEVYNTSGISVYKTIAQSDSIRIPVQAGIYIISTEKTTARLIVK